MFTQNFPLGTTVHIDLVSWAENCAVKTQIQLSIHRLHHFFHMLLCAPDTGSCEFIFSLLHSTNIDFFFFFFKPLPLVI